MKMTLDLVQHILRILIPDKPAGNLGMGFLRNYSLGAFALESAVYPVQFKGWTRTCSFNEGIAFFPV
ncbi:hypothetical protein D3C71_889900 [compost metagenome]